jgi:beta-galactosidase/beta-glucuronidase
MDMVRLHLFATALLIGTATQALAQTAGLPPVKPANSPTGTAGFTDPNTVQQGGPAYVGPIISKWGKAVTPQNAWRGYPRPQMVRKDWLNLNGQWDYAITPTAASAPDRMDGKILVPFAIESRLSGVARKLLPNDRLWYKRSFTLPAKWPGKRTLLHFGAVDFESAVWINGILVGSHKGGSDPFSFDVTPYLKVGANDLMVKVADPTSVGDQPRGKQTLEPRGIWYTAVSGIWQTVWLEPVPDLHITEVRAIPNIDTGTVDVDVLLNSGTAPGDAVRLTARAKDKVVATTVIRGNRRATLAIPGARLWSPDDPFLYDLTAELVKVEAPGDGTPRNAPGGMTRAEAEAYASAKVIEAGRDRVESYFGMRKISTGKHPRTAKPAIFLNNKPIFQNGTLDQGWWPESLLTPPSAEAARYDMEWLKSAGFNMLRKHIKVEPAQYYYDADRLGMLIWQDMPSGALGDQAVRRQSDREATMSSSAMAQYQLEMARIMGALRSFPSIVMWVTNNEGWGQYNSATLGAIAKNTDPSRLVNSASGWFDFPGNNSDVYDIHTYEEVPIAPEPHGDRPLVTGEYGGVGLPIAGHLWFTDRDARIYQFAADAIDYRARYKRKFDAIVKQAKENGLNASVYTETTDIEGELNGLLTYDRAIAKLPPEDLKAMAAPLFDDK